MSEADTLAGKNTPARKELVSTLRRIRRADRGGTGGEYYSVASDAYDYLAKLEGLSRFLEYTRSLGDKGLVLDLGAGDAVAAGQLSRSSFGQGLEIGAVTLTRKKQIVENLGETKAHITAIENLRGISDGSVSAVISVHGLSYSTFPEVSVRSMDRVLKPGGAIKSLFNSPLNPDTPKRPLEGSRKTPEPFAQALKKLGYDVAVGGMTQNILVAIKPGGSSTTRAEELLRSDTNHDAAVWRDEVKEVRKKVSLEAA